MSKTALDRKIRVRPMAVTDGIALATFHDGLTDETTRLRFFAVHRSLSPGELERFTHVDHHDREALVALDGAAIVGVGRYDRLPGTDDAEVAFVVGDAWQGDGVGSRLLAHLVRRGRAEGLRAFLADTLLENRRMREVFAHSGLVTGSASDGGVVQVVLDLTLAPA